MKKCNLFPWLGKGRLIKDTEKPGMTGPRKMQPKMGSEGEAGCGTQNSHRILNKVILVQESVIQHGKCFKSVGNFYKQPRFSLL